ncbi:MAG: restriction endonuclease subunit S [Phycisphaerae bacterium]|nr:restriction endonuclease subunit S [Phycisphaerae bacterium]
MIKEISLIDKDIFEIFIGERVLKRDVFNSSGKIPLFSANVFEPFGFLEKSNIENFDHDYLLWGIDGKFEFNIMKKGKIFATTDHCGCIKILDNRIVADYLLYQLRIKSHSLGFDRTLRPSLATMSKVIVSIPINKEGEFDKNEQIELAEKYKKIMKIRESLKQKIDDIKNASVEIELSKNSTRVNIGKIFDFPETNTGMTKQFCEKNKGNIPVYGCSESESSVLGFIKDNIKGVKYYDSSLTWNRNGSVGKVFIRNGRFSTNEDHRVLKMKKKYFGKIDPAYIRYVLENEIKKLGFSFTNKLGSTKMDKIEIPIPTKNEQIRLRNSYSKIDSIKEKLMAEMYNLNQVSVEIN